MKNEIEIPSFISDELKKNESVLSQFEKLSISCKNEYLKWVLEAKKKKRKKKDYQK
ncbi:MAG TPA: YdeI/OmpD-associated family protein [Chitinophagaceae bacterium]|nr:YdeI/OmpD-associated family protein [Chitinophagaceae bacterium]